MSSNNEEWEKCPPRADSVIQSLRDIGYNLPKAIADIVDNSIAAESRNIWINCKWQGSKTLISILDDGYGMSDATLREAMRLGTHNPLDPREKTDLGRFGFGLKSASFSQAKKLTVSSKIKSGKISVRCWDLEHVNTTKDWDLLKSAPEGTSSELAKLDGLQNGTVVIWQNLDRILTGEEDGAVARDVFLRKLRAVDRFLGMVFHRYLGLRGLSIHLNDQKIRAWDPFLSQHEATRELHNEPIQYSSEPIMIKPYVLPHKSKLSDKDHGEAGGPFGWNAHQGFYIYRNRRLIIFGSWLNLGFRKEDHYKLARILVDIPNSMDADWKISIDKSSVEPPDALKKELLKVAKLTRKEASDIYRNRGKVIQRKHDNINRFIWTKKVSRDRIKFLIDKKHFFIQDILRGCSHCRESIKELIKVIELTLPVEDIIITSNEYPDFQIIETELEGRFGDTIREYFLSLVSALCEEGKTREEAFHIALSTEPFDRFPQLISLLECN
ncbi:ATP-binding protein [Candidatus Neomarinimicrobiota bacterium]